MKEEKRFALLLPGDIEIRKRGLMEKRVQADEEQEATRRNAGQVPSPLALSLSLPLSSHVLFLLPLSLLFILSLSTPPSHFSSLPHSVSHSLSL